MEESSQSCSVKDPRNLDLTGSRTLRCSRTENIARQWYRVYRQFDENGDYQMSLNECIAMARAIHEMVGSNGAGQNTMAVKTAVRPDHPGAEHKNLEASMPSVNPGGLPTSSAPLDHKVVPQTQQQTTLSEPQSTQAQPRLPQSQPVIPIRQAPPVSLQPSSPQFQTIQPSAHAQPQRKPSQPPWATAPLPQRILGGSRSRFGSPEPVMVRTSSSNVIANNVASNGGRLSAMHTPPATTILPRC